jgi:hypothetical protein
MRTLFALVFLTLSAVTVQQSSPRSPTQVGKYNLSRTVPGPLGDEWLNWSPDARVKYIRGYYEGYNRGDRRGCLDTLTFFSDKGVQTNMAMPEDPAQNCMDGMLRWPNSKESYAEKITRYYETYRTDYGIPIPLMMEKLSPEKHMAPEQIHQWYLTGNGEEKP